MSTIIIQVTPDTERQLRHQAEQEGETLETYLGKLAERAVNTGTDQEAAERFVSDPRPTTAELEKLLGNLALGQSLPVLPADFSRADIYDDRD